MRTEKTGIVSRAWTVLAVGFAMLVGRAVLLAQDIEVKINPQEPAPGPPWYQVWWVWVLVALVFIIVIVAITNRGKGRETG